jgi:hypothetical protein
MLESYIPKLRLLAKSSIKHQSETKYFITTVYAVSYKPLAVSSINHKSET